MISRLNKRLAPPNGMNVNTLDTLKLYSTRRAYQLIGVFFPYYCIKIQFSIVSADLFSCDQVHV